MDLSWLLGCARTTFTHAETPIILPTNSGSKASLLSLCQSATGPCQLNPLLFNGHLQTFYTAVKAQDIPIHYKRKLFTQEDPAYPGTFAVDFVVNNDHDRDDELDESLPPRTNNFMDVEFESIGSSDDRPMLILLHGLSGGSHELYLRHVVKHLCPIEGSPADRGRRERWEACVVNARGCAMSQISSPLLFNARATWDLRQVVRWLRKAFPNRPLFAIGFSLGGNILTNVCL